MATSKSKRAAGLGGTLFGYERRHHAVLPWPAFRRRLGVNVALGCGAIFLSLAVGMAGYSWFEGFGFLQSFLNTSMILSGMGPVDELTSDGGKLFAGFYALYSGIAVLAVAGLVFAPLIHRLLHHFHAADDADDADDADADASAAPSSRDSRPRAAPRKHR